MPQPVVASFSTLAVNVPTGTLGGLAPAGSAPAATSSRGNKIRSSDLDRAAHPPHATITQRVID